MARYYRSPLTSSHVRGGVVLIAIRALISSSLVHIDINYVEQICIILTISSFKLLVGVNYLLFSFQSSLSEVDTTTVETKITSINPSFILLCGDYNLLI